MASIGKKILSAFMEVTDEEPAVTRQEDNRQSTGSNTPVATSPQQADDGKFRHYFEKLFTEANLPGPDYYEFSKMIEAMSSIPDEKARYTAAFAGLRVQGLSKQKLLETASAYVEILDKDAGSFLSTVDAAMQEKVLGKQQEMADKKDRIQQLTAAITDLQNQLALLSDEIKENEEKLTQSRAGYNEALEHMKAAIGRDTEKIKLFIQ